MTKVNSDTVAFVARFYRGGLKMGTIVVHSMLHGVYKQGGHIRLEVDTAQDGMSAWSKDFDDAKDIKSLLLELSPDETVKITDFITHTVNYGEERVDIHCSEQDFSKYGFEKLPPA
jgi:hypothetical protein